MSRPCARFEVDSRALSSHAKERTMTPSRWLAIATLGACLTAPLVRGNAQSESDLAKASQNPVANLTSFPLQFNYYTGGGLESKTAMLLNVQPVLPLPINKKWIVISRTVVPY